MVHFVKNKYFKKLDFFKCSLTDFLLNSLITYFLVIYSIFNFVSTVVQNIQIFVFINETEMVHCNGKVQYGEGSGTDE